MESTIRVIAQSLAIRAYREQFPEVDRIPEDILEAFDRILKIPFSKQDYYLLEWELNNRDKK